MTGRTLPWLDEDDLRQVRQVFEGTRTGHAAAITALLGQGLPANRLNEKGDSLLMLAAYHGRLELARLLHGADPAARDAAASMRRRWRARWPRNRHWIGCWPAAGHNRPRTRARKSPRPQRIRAASPRLFDCKEQP